MDGSGAVGPGSREELFGLPLFFRFAFVFSFSFFFFCGGGGHWVGWGEVYPAGEEGRVLGLEEAELVGAVPDASTMEPVPSLLHPAGLGAEEGDD